MIGSWLIKIVAGVALFGVAVFEIGSPLVAKVQVDDAAHVVADAAATEYFDSGDEELARARAEEVALDHDVVITEFFVEIEGPLTVTVAREAPSLVMHNFQFAKDWYDVRVQASAIPRRKEL